ncbi:MAG TPA: hypothetical protein VFB58_11780 [Chloroflexota bacterium]|nr:hypothetical protein [Chloroflexota bacterium]
MALLRVLAEEEIAEEGAEGYLDNLYRIVCVGERPATRDQPGGLVRTTYVVDWEQLVCLLEEYDLFAEDIVELSVISGDAATLLRSLLDRPIARA